MPVKVPIDGLVDNSRDVRRGLAMMRRRSKPNRAAGSDVLLAFADASFTNANGDRYAWNPLNNTLYGPFAANNLATFLYRGRKYASVYEAVEETTGHTENFDYWTQIGGGRIGWEETQPAGDNDKDWRTLGSSSSGQYKLAGIATGRLYVSNDSGETWTEVQPAGDVDGYWTGGSVSGTGQYMIATRGTGSGRVYVSDDYGVTWAEVQPAGDVDKNWQMSAIDATGEHMMAGQDSGRLWTSDDFGATWTERRPGGDADFRWLSGASDSTGQYLIVGAYGGRLWTSDDYGATWDERQPAGAANKNWYTVSIDSTGANMLAAGDGMRAYTSTNFGVGWGETQPAGAADKNWRSSCSSSDGQRLRIGNDVRAYSTGDGGTTWNEIRPEGDANKNWRRLSCDATGAYAIAGGSVRLYNETPIAAPDAAKFATRLLFEAAAGDGMLIALGSATDDTDQTEAVWVKTEAGTKAFRLAFVEKDATVTYSAELTATTTWQRFDVTVDIDAGGTTPEVRIVNNAGATAGEMYVWGGAVYKDVSFPWSYRTNETGADQTQNKDVLLWAAGVPDIAAFKISSALKYIPYWADTEGMDWSTLSSFYKDVDHRVSPSRFRSATDKYTVRFKDGGGADDKVLSDATDHARYALLTQEFYPSIGRMVLAGYDAGDGPYDDTAWDALITSDHKLYWGQWGDGAASTTPVNGLICEPYTP